MSSTSFGRGSTTPSQDLVTKSDIDCRRPCCVSSWDDTHHDVDDTPQLGCRPGTTPQSDSQKTGVGRHGGDLPPRGSLHPRIDPRIGSQPPIGGQICPPRRQIYPPGREKMAKFTPPRRKKRHFLGFLPPPIEKNHPFFGGVAALLNNILLGNFFGHEKATFVLGGGVKNERGGGGIFPIFSNGNRPFFWIFLMLGCQKKGRNGGIIPVMDPHFALGIAPVFTHKKNRSKNLLLGGQFPPLGG